MLPARKDGIRGKLWNVLRAWHRRRGSEPEALATSCNVLASGREYAGEWERLPRRRPRQPRFPMRFADCSSHQANNTSLISHDYHITFWCSFSGISPLYRDCGDDCLLFWKHTGCTHAGIATNAALLCCRIALCAGSVFVADRILVSLRIQKDAARVS